VGNIHLKIDNKIEEAWRQACGKKFGVRKGSLQRGMEEALKMWLANQE